MLKKILALALAGAMVLGSMSMGAFAADDQDTQIQISGLKDGDKVHLYKVVEWGGDVEGNVSGWIATSDFSSLLDEDELAKTIDTSENGYHGLTSELAGDLSRAAVHEVTGSPFTVSGTSFTHTIPVEELGMYMAIIEPKDVDTVYNPVFVSADWKAGDNIWNVTEDSTYEGKTAAKKSTLTLTKTAASSQDYTTPSDQGDTVAVGDVLDFTVQTTIPGYGQTFDSPVFKISDTMTDLAFQTGSLTIVDDGDNDLNGKYELTEGADGYTVTFNTEYLRSLVKAVPITLTYKAEVLESAEIANVNTEKNTVELEYSHNPATEKDGKEGGDKKYKKDITNHYTFSIDADNLFKGSKIIGESGSELIKIAVDRDGNPITSEVKTYSNITKEEYEASPLAGCTFELKDKNGDSFDPPKTVQSDAAGRIKFENLDAGTYKLEEISAPAGYVRDTSVHTIVITAELVDKDYTEYYDQAGQWYNTPDESSNLTRFDYSAKELKSYKITFDNAEVANHTFIHVSDDEEIQWSVSTQKELPASIHNTKGVELPSTGGIGTTIFYMGGAVLVLLAGVLLVSKRRIA